MNILLIEQTMRPTTLIRELCQGGNHQTIQCRDIQEASVICRQHDGGIDWIIINGLPAESSATILEMIRSSGCEAPVAYLAAGKPAGIQGVQTDVEEGRGVLRHRLSRLDLFRLLTQPGGAFEREDILFEYHAPHAGKRTVIQKEESVHGATCNI